MNRGLGQTILLPLAVCATYLFLYLPIAVLIIFSFNDQTIGFTWGGFTTRWYVALWQSSDVWQALQTSFTVAALSVTLSLMMGVLFVCYTNRTWLHRLVMLFYINVAVPEIVLAVGLLSLFHFFAVPLSLTTLIAAHTVLGFGYVIPILYSRFEEIDVRIMEASLDLGATPTQTMYRIIIPLLRPALISAGLLVFIISFDDFIISFFCAGASTQTLPLYIFSVIRAGTSPLVTALSTVLLVVSSLLVLLFLSLQIKKTDFLP